MQAALYHPVHGYYRRGTAGIGAKADFLTAPEHHPAFGRLVGRRVAQVARRTGGAHFTVVEQGAGLGGLASGILTELQAQGFPLRYRIVEPFPEWEARQRERLTSFAGAVEWVPDLEALPPFHGFFVCNELPDAFPVHRLIRRADGLREWYVAAQGEALVEQEAELSTPDLSRYLDELGVPLPQDHTVEICLELTPWVRAVADRLQEGSLLVIDYGATAEELYERPRRSEGTLRAYQRHTAVDPLATVGEADLTADVDFTTLIRAAEASGLSLHAFTTQRAFLRAMGWEEWLHRPDGGSRKALMELIDPRLMGSTRVAELVRRPHASAPP